MCVVYLHNEHFNEMLNAKLL